MIDTLKLSKRLQETGLSEVKTLAFVDVLREIPGAKPDRPFDTLAHYKRLIAAGFTEPQAELLVEAGLDAWQHKLRATLPRAA